MTDPFLVNIEDIPWQICMLNNVTEDEAYSIVGSLAWFPELKNYFGIVCSNTTVPSSMEYTYFYTAEEALSFIYHQLNFNKKYFLLRQMTEEELQTTLERLKYNRLLQANQGHVQGE